jgi:hypothetical protein
MTRLFTEGFEEGYLGGQPWLVSGSTYNLFSIIGAGRTTGSYTGNALGFGQGGIIETAGNYNTDILYVRFAVRQGGISAIPADYMQLMASSGAIVKVKFGYSSVVTVTVGTNVFSGNTLILQNNNWHLIEVFAQVSGTDVNIIFKIDGLVQGSGVAQGQVAANTKFKSVRWIAPEGSNNFTFWLDDVAINDAQGTVDNSWCGDGRVIALRPNANGTTTSMPWDGSDGNSTDNYALVNTYEGNDTNYVRSDTVDALDWYGLPDVTLNSGEKINRVWVSGIARQESSSGGAFKLGLMTSGGTQSFSGDLSLGTSYRVYTGDVLDKNPQNNSAWTSTAVNGLQIGVKVV